MRRIIVLASVFVFLGTSVSFAGSSGKYGYKGYVNKTANAERVQNRADSFCLSNPVRAQNLAARAQRLRTEAAAMQPLGLGLKKLDRTVNRINALNQRIAQVSATKPKLAAKLAARAGRLTNKTAVISDNGRRAGSAVTNSLTERTTALNAQAAAIKDKKPKQAAQLEARAGRLNAKSNWIRDGLLRSAYYR